MPRVNTDLAANGALPVPLYEHVKRRISEAILLGRWEPGMVLPSEVALAGQFGVAVGTVRRALADLTTEGMLMRRRKSGTVVTGRTPQHSLRFFFRYFRLHGADGRLLHSEPEVLSLHRGEATDAEAAGLALDTGVEVIRLHRLRRVCDAPAMHQKIVLPASRVPGFGTEAVELPALLYVHLLEAHGIRVSAVREQVTAGLATEEDVRLLRLPHPAAVLIIDAVSYDQSGAAVMLSHHRATTHGYIYVNEIR
jgi:GntR family transcriptional regulator